MVGPLRERHGWCSVGDGRQGYRKVVGFMRIERPQRSRHSGLPASEPTIGVYSSGVSFGGASA